MKYMAGRRRHSAEDIVRKLRRADELVAEGKTGEEVGRAYAERRTAEGMSMPEIIRCQKCYLVREIFGALRTDYAELRT